MKRTVLLDTSYLLPKEMALKTVMSVVSQFKDGKTRTLQNLDAVPSFYSFTGKTAIKTDFKTAKPETPSLYIANFTNQEGYVLISADMRAPEILGYSATGNLDSTVHNGLKLTLVNSLHHVDEKVAEAENLRYDSTYNRMVKKLEDHFAKKYGKKLPLHKGKKPEAAARKMDYEGYGECEYYYHSYPTLEQTGVRKQTGPLLQTEWTQNPPFNEKYSGSCFLFETYTNTRTNRTRTFYNNHYLAGCVPIAEAQLVAYLAANNPSNSSFEGLSRQGWRDITAKSPVDYTDDDIARVSGLVQKVLLHYTNADINKVTLGCNVTGVYPDNPANPLGIWTSSTGWSDYNAGNVKASILESGPVLIRGFNEAECGVEYSWSWSWRRWAFVIDYFRVICVGRGGGHQWVIDGWRDTQNETTYYNYWGYYPGYECNEQQRDYGGSSTYTVTQITASYMHNNWGWGASYNVDGQSWFAPGIFTGGNNNFDKLNRIVPTNRIR